MIPLITAARQRRSGSTSDPTFKRDSKIFWSAQVCYRKEDMIAKEDDKKTKTIKGRSPFKTRGGKLT